MVRWRFKLVVWPNVIEIIRCLHLIHFEGRDSRKDVVILATELAARRWTLSFRCFP